MGRPSLRRRLARLAGPLRAMAQDAAAAVLGREPVYVVLASTLPEQLRSPNRGWTGPALDLALRPHVAWRGRGPAIVVADGTIAEEVAAMLRARPAANPNRIFRGELLDVVAHEAAHVAAADWSFDEEPGPEFAELATAALAAWCARESRESDYCQPVPFAGHDARFVRAAIHVARRLGSRLDVGMYPPDTMNYRLSSRWRYAAALGDEPQRLQDLPLSALQTIPPPRPFAELWRQDLRGWFDSVQSPTDAQTEALVAGLRLFSTEPAL